MTEHTERRQDNAPLWPKRLREAAARLDAEGKAHKVPVARHMRQLAYELEQIIEAEKQK